jgi:hypothetical protein
MHVLFSIQVKVELEYLEFQLYNSTIAACLVAGMQIVASAVDLVARVQIMPVTYN